MKNTKESIVAEAMQLFARSGYEAVSIRDIAGKVGIRESSVYNHFRNKQEIFDTIIARSVSQMQEYFKSVGVPPDAEAEPDMYDGLSYEELLLKVENTFRFYFENENAVLLRRILLISQYEDMRCRSIYRMVFYEVPLRIQTRVFERLMKKKQFKKGDPGLAAVEFFGPVFMMIHVCDSYEEMQGRLREHLRSFLKQHEEKEQE